jgi:hypothetical protein
MVEMGDEGCGEEVDGRPITGDRIATNAKLINRVGLSLVFLPTRLT